MSRRNAFTLVELLVVLAIIMILVAIIAPSLQPVMEMARQRKCMANLGKIVKDSRTYGLTNDGFFPNAFPNINDDNAVGVDRQAVTPSKSGSSRSLFTLVRGKQSTVAAFACPSTDDTAYTTADLVKDYDFMSYKNFSYSYQRQKDNGTDPYYPVTTTSDASLVVLADRNPIIGDDGWSGSDAGGWTYGAPIGDGGDKLTGMDKYDKNSFNHNQLGQACAMADSSVTFAANPNVSTRPWSWTDPSDNVVKPANDNIWTPGDINNGSPIHNAGNFLGARPTTPRDTLLRP